MANYAVLCVSGGVEINPSDKLISVPLVGAGGVNPAHPYRTFSRRVGI
ncbi:hypothetical protein LU276_02685 [Moraxella haemolytica]|nr:hypothetical protein [Moraxella sp. ZY171148]WII95757.1 hypothetical protein LU276_02685 [Moraxella sp. ZY171148]